MTEINQTQFFYLFEFRDAALHGVYMYGENTIAAIRSVIGALWPPLWVPPKLARRRRAGCCKACQRSRKNRRRLLHAAHLLAGTRLHSCRVPARSVRGQRGASVGQEPRWEAIKERRRD